MLAEAFVDVFWDAAMVGRSAKCGVMALLLAMAGTAYGAGDAPPQAPIPALIANLHSIQYATREAATVALMKMGGEHQSDIEQALALEKDPEAAGRLERVAVHLYMKQRTPLVGDIGVLGITLKAEPVQLDPKSPTVQLAIVVMKTQPGFPAAESLAVADRILGVDGERLSIQSNPDDFRTRINGTKPGRSVLLMVLRGGKVLDIPIRLAGLRLEEAPLFKSIVDRRDAMALEYVAGLRRADLSRSLVIADDPAPEDGQQNDGASIESTVPPK